jgi:NAD-dependent DNA ligase
MGREAAAAAVRERGGTVSGSVSSRIRYLVRGANPGARKVRAAEAHGVEQLDEQAFLALLGMAPRSTAPVEQDRQAQLL